MKDAAILERRRDALKTAAQLQRRNVTIRWHALRAKRSVQWVESGLAATRALRDASGRAVVPRGFGRSRAWIWFAVVLRMFARSRGGFVGTALNVLRRPSLWSVAMVVGQWWWRRRSRRRHDGTVRARRKFAMS